jgi:hypothetical protein
MPACMAAAAYLLLIAIGEGVGFRQLVQLLGIQLGHPGQHLPTGGLLLFGLQKVRMGDPGDKVALGAEVRHPQVHDVLILQNEAQVAGVPVQAAGRGVRHGQIGEGNDGKVLQILPGPEVLKVLQDLVRFLSGLGRRYGEGF